MYLQEILEVAIGLVFVWLVLSVATMSFQEWIANAINLRAKEMEKYIAQMLSSEDLTRQFYKHPLIASLYSQSKKPGRKPRLPAYIPANKFGAALFELIIQAGTDNSPIQAITGEIEKQLVAIESPEQQKLAKDDWDAILETARRIAASDHGVTAVDSLKLQVQAYGEKYPEIQPALDTLIPQLDTFYGQFVEEQRAATESGPDTGLAMQQFRLGLLALHKINPRLNESVTAILRLAETYAMRGEQAIATTRVNLEAWFNDAMERLSGAYKRRAQLMAFAVGFILALILNVDTINIATSLWREPTLRQAIIAQAQSYAPPAASQDGTTPGPLENIPALETQLQVLNIPFGWTTASFDTAGRQCSLLPLTAGQVWGIPSQDDQGLPICKKLNNLPADIFGWLAKILGMIMTGAAAAQGSPFWFDILKKLVNVRGTGTNPSEKKPVG